MHEDLQKAVGYTAIVNEPIHIADSWHYNYEQTLSPSLRQIVNDDDFWSRLEYDACTWLSSSEDKRTSHIWIDGFSPERICC